MQGWYGDNTNDNALKVEWTNDQNADFYNIYAMSTGSGNWLQLASDVCGGFHEEDAICEWSINYWDIPDYFQLYSEDLPDAGDSFLVHSSSFSLAAVAVDKNGNVGSLPGVDNQVVITDTVGPWIEAVSQVNPEDFSDTPYSANAQYDLYDDTVSDPTSITKTIYLLVEFSEHMDTSGDFDPNITLTDSYDNTSDSIVCGADTGNLTATLIPSPTPTFTWLPNGHYGYFTITLPWGANQTNDFYVIEYSAAHDSSGNAAIESLPYDDDIDDEELDYLSDSVSWNFQDGNTYDPNQTLDDRMWGSCLQ
jgi:hypothetical protein